MRKGHEGGAKLPGEVREEKGCDNDGEKGDDGKGREGAISRGLSTEGRGHVAGRGGLDHLCGTHC